MTNISSYSSQVCRREPGGTGPNSSGSDMQSRTYRSQAGQQPQPTTLKTDNGKLAACRLNPYYIVQCVASYLMGNWATLWGSPCRPFALVSQNDDRAIDRQERSKDEGTTTKEGEGTVNEGEGTVKRLRSCKVLFKKMV